MLLQLFFARRARSYRRIGRVSLCVRLICERGTPVSPPCAVDGRADPGAHRTLGLWQKNDDIRCSGLFRVARRTATARDLRITPDQKDGWETDTEGRIRRRRIRPLSCHEFALLPLGLTLGKAEDTMSTKIK